MASSVCVGGRSQEEIVESIKYNKSCIIHKSYLLYIYERRRREKWADTAQWAHTSK